MSRRFAAAAIAGLVSCAVAAPAFARVCYQPTEIRAMQFRQLQVELMVAALKCRQADPSFRDKYAGYIGKVDPALKRNAQELRALFVRQGKGAAHMDRFMTDLSNQASIRSMDKEIEDYCAAQDAVFSKVLAMKPQEIETFAAQTMDSQPDCAPVRQVKAEKVKEPAGLKTKVKAKTKADERKG